jgi:hypothetical protein
MLGCHPTAMACSHGVEANVNTRLTCLCAVEERSCPVLHRIDEVGCYGRLAVVSDVDDGEFALNVDKELRGSAVLYRSKYNGAMLRSRWT